MAPSTCYAAKTRLAAPPARAVGNAVTMQVLLAWWIANRKVGGGHGGVRLHRRRPGHDPRAGPGQPAVPRRAAGGAVGDPPDMCADPAAALTRQIPQNVPPRRCVQPAHRRLARRCAHADRHVPRCPPDGATPPRRAPARRPGDTFGCRQPIHKTECAYGPDATGWDDVGELELATLSWLHWSNDHRLTATAATSHPPSTKPRSTLPTRPTTPWSESNGTSLQRTQGGSAG